MDLKFKLLGIFVILCLVLSFSSVSASTKGNTEKGLVVNITYPGKWTGTITEDDQLRQIGGTGNRTFPISGLDRSLAAEVKKSDNLEAILILSIRRDGHVVDSDTIVGTSGIAMVMDSML